MGGRGPPDRGGLGERSSPSVAVVEGLPVPREPACADERSQDGEAKSASSERMPRRHPRTPGERGTGNPVWWSHHACPFWDHRETRASCPFSLGPSRATPRVAQTGGRGPPDRGGWVSDRPRAWRWWRGCPCPESRRVPTSAARMAKRSRHRVSGCHEGIRERPANGARAPPSGGHTMPVLSGDSFGRLLSGDSPIHLSSAQRSRSGGCSTSVGDFASAAPGRSRHGPPWRNIPARRQPPARRGSPPRRLSFLGFLGHFAGWPDFPAGFSQFLGDSAVPRPPKKPLAKPSAIRYYTRVQCSFPRQIARLMVAKQPPRRRAGNRGRQQP